MAKCVHAPELQLFSYTLVVIEISHIFGPRLEFLIMKDTGNYLQELGMTCLVRKPVHYLFTADGETQHWY